MGLIPKHNKCSDKSSMPPGLILQDIYKYVGYCNGIFWSPLVTRTLANSGLFRMLRILKNPMMMGKSFMPRRMFQDV